MLGQAAGAPGRKKTPSDPEYEALQRMWHTTLNQGMQPADFSHKSEKRVWLQCPGCRHGCGRQHEWDAEARGLTKYGGRIVCPYCESRGRGRRYCECQSVAADKRLSKEWHPDNPPATQVAKNSKKKYLWKCPKGHKPYLAACSKRCSQNTGCPMCGEEKTRAPRPHHPLVSVGRPDLAEEWDNEGNDKSPDQVTLGSHHVALWRCRVQPEHLWQARVCDRALKGNGCPECKEANRFSQRKFGSAQQYW